MLAWRLSNTMDVAFCVDALDEALARFGGPEIINTDVVGASPASGRKRLVSEVIGDLAPLMRPADCLWLPRGRTVCRM